MGYKYDNVCFGGTFDMPLHRGHKALIRKAFEIGRFCLIGLTSDKYARSLFKEESHLIKNYRLRKENLTEYLNKNYTNRYRIVQLKKFYTKELLKPNKIQAIVVSEDTFKTALRINKIRVRKKTEPMKILKIKMVMAEDHIKISSSRIRKMEIDEEGRLLK